MDRICRWAISYKKCNVLEKGKLSGDEYKIDSQTIVLVENVVDVRVTMTIS